MFLYTNVVGDGIYFRQISVLAYEVICANIRITN